VGGRILFGLSAVKNVGEGAAEAILAERAKGPYKSFADFLLRLDEKVANRRAVESLIKAGAFDRFAERGQLLAALDEFLRWASLERERRKSGFGLLFDSVEPPLPKTPPLDEVTRLRYEKEALGLYLSGHPVLRYPGLKEAATTSLAGLRAYLRTTGGRRARVILAGVVEEVVRKPTRSGGMMARFILSDETGALEAIAFGRAYERVSPRLKEDVPVLLLAEVEEEEENLRLLAQAVYPYEELAHLPRAVELELDLALLDEETMVHLRSLLEEHPGTLPLYLKVEGPFGEALLAAREVRVGEEVLALLEKEGYRGYTVPDREALWGLDQGGEAAVPF